MSSPLVPTGFENALFAAKINPDARKLLRWLQQKESLQQDVFLLGSVCGGPLPRWLILHYCAVMNRPVQCVSLTRDSTESDLKQRREIVCGEFLWISFVLCYL